MNKPSDPADEIVDVVDENDNAIGQELKSVCHAKLIAHRGAAILIFKDSSFKEILLQKRSIQKKTNPGRFAFTGGHVKSGCGYLETAKRELQEELFHDRELPDGLEFEELFKMKREIEDPEFIIVYRVVWPGPFNVNPEEVDFVFFENVNDLAQKMKEHPEQYSGTSKQIMEEHQNILSNSN